MEKLVPNLIHIKLKPIKTPYVSREAEEFYATKLESIDKEYGFAQADHLRVKDLSGEAPRIRLIPLEWIDTIDGITQAPRQTEWQVKGSSGKSYTINLIGDRYTCTCSGFKYRKHCKHVKEFENA